MVNFFFYLHMCIAIDTMIGEDVQLLFDPHGLIGLILNILMIVKPSVCLLGTTLWTCHLP